MAYERGEYFFHYTTGNAAFSHILPSGQLRLSPYDQMRDPLENKRWRFGGSYFVEPVEVDEGHPDHPEAAFWKFQRKADAIKSSAKLLSLTVDDPEAESASFSRGWSRARMWEQYAEQHAGVCLLFERKQLAERVRESLLGQDFPPPYHRPVEYTPEGPGGGLTLDLGSLAGKVTPERVAAYIEDHHDELFFLKTDDWRTEVEYRFVVTAMSNEAVFVDYGDALHAVIVGEKFPKWQRAGAIETCREVKAEPLRLDWSLGHPLPIPLEGGNGDK